MCTYFKWTSVWECIASPKTFPVSSTTAAAVVDETGNVLGEAIHSQTEVHLK